MSFIEIDIEKPIVGTRRIDVFSDYTLANYFLTDETVSVTYGPAGVIVRLDRDDNTTILYGHVVKITGRKQKPSVDIHYGHQSGVI